MIKANLELGIMSVIPGLRRQADFYEFETNSIFQASGNYIKPCFKTNKQTTKNFQPNNIA